MTHPAIVQAGNAIGLATMIGSAVGVLPAIAAALAIVWYVLQIVESPTLRAVFKRRPRADRKPEDLPPGSDATA